MYLSPFENYYLHRKSHNHRTLNLYHLPIKVYGAIAQNDQYPHLVKWLYSFARSLDVSGRGIVEFDIAKLAKTLNRSISTIKTNLRKARRLGVFRVLKISGLSVKAAYISLPKLCFKLGVQKLGAIYELDSNKFHTLRAIATSQSYTLC